MNVGIIGCGLIGNKRAKALVDSRLLIVNPPAGYVVPDWSVREYFEWDEAAKEFRKLFEVKAPKD